MLSIVACILTALDVNATGVLQRQQLLVVPSVPIHTTRRKAKVERRDGGGETSGAGSVSTAATTTKSATAKEPERTGAVAMLRVEGACDRLAMFIGGNFSRLGVTADNKPYYRKEGSRCGFTPARVPLESLPPQLFPADFVDLLILIQTEELFGLSSFLCA